MIETIETGSTKLLGMKLYGTLHDEDYKQFVPQIEAILTTEGKVRLFIQLEDFHGWELHAAWDDLKFATNHYSDFERIALVGDRKWEKWMAALCKPFTKARVMYFDHAEVEAAWNWLREETPTEQEPAETEPLEKERILDPANQPESWRGFPWYGF